MPIRAKVEGGSRLQKKLQRIPRDARLEVSESILTMALLVQSTAQRGIQKGPKTGRVYEKYDPRRTHRASAAGEFPATDTGRLVASIFANMDADGLGASVGTNLDYGTYLEFGTAAGLTGSLDAGAPGAGVGMAARPWLFPTFERLKPRITRSVGAGVRKVLKRESR